MKHWGRKGGKKTARKSTKGQNTLRAGEIAM